jgi:hypothetical protein
MEHSSLQAQWMPPLEGQWADNLPEYKIGGDVSAGRSRLSCMSGNYGLGHMVLTGKGIILRSWFWEKYDLTPAQVTRIRVDMACSSQDSVLFSPIQSFRLTYRFPRVCPRAAR